MLEQSLWKYFLLWLLTFHFFLRLVVMGSDGESAQGSVFMPAGISVKTQSTSSIQITRKTIDTGVSNLLV